MSSVLPRGEALGMAAAALPPFRRGAPLDAALLECRRDFKARPCSARVLRPRSSSDNSEDKRRRPSRHGKGALRHA